MLIAGLLYYTTSNTQGPAYGLLTSRIPNVVLINKIRTRFNCCRSGNITSTTLLALHWITSNHINAVSALDVCDADEAKTYASIALMLALAGLMKITRMVIRMRRVHACALTIKLLHGRIVVTIFLNVVVLMFSFITL